MNGELLIPLGELCHIRSGQTFKDRLDAYAKGEVTVLLPKDIAQGKINSSAAKISATEVPQLEKHLLRAGDIIIVNKGVRFSTFIFSGDMGNVVATTAFYVISAGEKIEPEYLFWYLNQAEAKAFLSENVQGSVIPAITKNVLMRMPVPFVSDAKQHHVVSFLKKTANEQLVLKVLMEKKEAFKDSYIWEIIKEIAN
ncbi:restriction endonuclease subunit S [Pedobacter nototheniae]|uniref:restriction endonuclease subunit S n=1 Tax=Pedobacter nototheniae TaxID=2488994 RepID=UPI0010399C92|nr:restriction endonuclease subunit S [Pedobacter nototheniae]